MSEKMISGAVAILVGIIGVAIVAMLVSQHSNTGSVLTAGGSSFGGALGCALSPLTGGSCGGGGLMPSVNSSISFPGLGGM